MKQIAFLLSLCLPGLTPVQAQHKPSAFIEVFGGLSRPLGAFSQSNYASPAAGFGKLGPLTGVSGALFFGGNLGLSSTLLRVGYGVNTFALADGYRADFAVDNATASSKRYTVGTLLVGPCYALSFGRFTLDLRGLVGASVATLPALRVALEDQSVFIQNRATATAFAWQAGAGLRVRLVKTIGLSLRADYLTTRPAFAVSYDGLHNASGRTIASYNQPISSLNATLGVFYQFGK